MYVRVHGEITQSDTIASPDLATNPYTALFINTTAAVVLIKTDGTLLPAFSFTGGVWHHVEFAGIADTGTVAAAVYGGRVVSGGV
jgi:hypothetical protein